ncbi:MAG: sigma-70 family RNA polymerase sigma factor [Pseudomonadota bacterium]
MSGAPFHERLGEETSALRAFARTLSRNAAQADDLVQETLLKAWANRDRYQEGTNLRAWLFTILRNTFYSHFRKKRREVEDVDGAHAERLAEAPTQEHALALQDFRRALEELPEDQREALVLVGAAGLSYEEAAEVANAAVGTIKSRVSRARAALSERLGVSSGGEMVQDSHMSAALGAAAATAA